jgi:hypothetical protein
LQGKENGHEFNSGATRQALDRHLDILEREGLVITWYDGAIVPGS